MSDPIRNVEGLSESKRRLYELLLAREEEAENLAEGPIPKHEGPEPAPLSLGQERLWFLQHMVPESCAYNVPAAVRLRGPLDRPALSRSLAAVARRHAPLRTRLPELDGGPVQVVDGPARVPLAVVDLGGLAAGRRERLVFTLAREVNRHPFDLASGPLVRTVLLDLGASDAALLLDLHHTVCDGTSIGLLVEEVATCYEAELQGTRAWLPPLPVQYPDFAAWQRRTLAGEGLDGRLDYWRGVLAGPLPLLDLPTDRPRPPVQGSRGARCYFTVPPVQALALRTLAGREKVTLFVVLMAGLQALLQRYAGQDDFLVGMPVSGRPRPELERLVGFFVDTVVLRADLGGEPSFRELLRRVSRATVGALAHQDVGFENLVEAFAPERDLSRSPLFQTVISLQEAPLEPVERAGLVLEPLDVDSGTARFDLELVLWQVDRGLTGYFEYALDLFDGTTVARAARHLLRLLAAGAEAPDRPVSALSPLDRAERHQLLSEECDPGPTGGGLSAVLDRVAARAAEAPDAVAVVAGSRTWTYDELWHRAGELGRRMQAAGAGSEVVVAIVLERSPELLAAALGAWRAGAAYLPLEPGHPAERLAAILADSGARLVVTREALSGGLPGGAPPVVTVDGGEPGAPAGALPDAPGDPRGLAYVIYTSGSTGAPKGVAVARGGLDNLVCWHRRVFALGPDDGGSLLASPAFDASVWEAWPVLATGGSLWVPSEEARSFAPSLRDAIIRSRITVGFAPTPLAEGLLGVYWPPDTPLRTLLTGGDRLRLAPPAGLPFELVNDYGPTESTVVATSGPVAPSPESEADPEPASAVGLGPSIGRAIDGLRVLLMDRAFRPAPWGARGEICIGGAGLARGYLGRPGASAERFAPDPAGETPGGRLYRTGDLARFRHDGTLDFLGRADGQVKVRGFRVELGEVEAALLTHPAVAEAAAAVSSRGEGAAATVLVAYVALAPGAQAEPEALRGHLVGRLPEAMVPSVVRLLPELPRTPSGKIDRRSLPEPEWERVAAGRGHVPPRNDRERALATIWCEVLGCERVGVEDDFFALGGQSLLATRVVSRVRAELGIELPLRTLFVRPTIAALARELAEETAEPETVPPVVPVPRDRPLPLSFAQERLWFLDRLVPGISAYNVPGLVQLSGRLDRPLLCRVLEEILRRHEVLRSRFPEREGRPAQVVDPPPRVALPEIDLRHLGERAEARALALAAEEARRPFDLAAGGLVRFTLFRLRSDRWLLAVVIHHVVFDMWSRSLFIEELSTLYRAFAAGAASPLPEPATQYGDFAAWQRGWLRDERLEALLERWADRLEGARFTLDLPADHTRRASQSFRGARATRVIDAETSAGVARFAERLGTTPFTVGLATFLALLARLAGQDDLVVGVPIANRNRLEIEGLIGFFTNTLVLRGGLSGDPSFAELVGRVREEALGAFADQDLPFELLVDHLQPERDRSRQPLVQVVFNFIEGYVPRPVTVGDLTLSLDRRIHSGGAPFDLTLAMFEVEGRYNLALDYATDLFDATTASRWTRYLESLLAQALREPDRPVAALAPWSEGERHQVLVETNDTALAVPAPTVLALVAAAVERSPDAVALVEDGEGREHLSYGELAARAAGRARELHLRGAGPGSRVATLLEPGAELVVTLVAVLAADAAYVPLEASFPAERLRLLLADADPALVVTSEALSPGLAGVPIPRVTVEKLAGARGDLAHAVAGGGTGPDALAYVMYTSGSTGRPKGVAVAHRGIVRLVQEPRYARLGPDETLLQLAPVGFDASTFEIWGALAHGGRLVVLPARELDPDRLERALAAERVTTLWLTAGLFHQVVDRAPDALGGLRQLLAGGDALSPAHVDRVLAELPGRALINGYGPTEGTTFTCCRRFTGARDPHPSVPIGRPIDATRVFVLDRGLRPVPTGVAGDLWVAGDGLAWGYLGRPARTAAAFVPDPFGLPGGRLYRTGDRVRRLAGGDLEFLGRRDLQVKVRGFRVEPGEVEAVLSGHPAVRATAVIAVAGGPAADHRLAAFVVPAEGAAPTVRELRSHLEERLPRAMIPSSWALVDALPLTANGKVDRRALAAAEAPALDTGTEHVAPRSELEEELAELWGDLLGVASVGVHDNFFHVGGHSLLATQLVSQVRARYRLDLPLATFFESPTVADLARAVEVTRWAAGGPGDASDPAAEELEEGEL